MEQQQFFDLVRGIEDFNNIVSLRPFLETIFEQPGFVFPMVVGERTSAQQSWEVRRLNPLTDADRLTIENYLIALKFLETQKDTQNFLGRLVYSKVDSLHYSNLDTNILQVSVKEKADPKSRQSFGLTLHYSEIPAPHSGSKDIGYAAWSSISKTRLEEACSRFRGPNREYRQLLL